MEKDYEIESALDTLIRAKEIESDSELMKKVQKLAKDKSSKILSIADLKKEYQKVAKEEEDENEDQEEESEEKEIKIVIKQESSLMTEEDKVALQDKKELEKKNKGKLGDLKYE